MIFLGSRNNNEDTKIMTNIIQKESSTITDNSQCALPIRKGKIQAYLSPGTFNKCRFFTKVIIRYNFSTYITTPEGNKGKKTSNYLWSCASFLYTLLNFLSKSQRKIQRKWIIENQQDILLTLRLGLSL